MQSTAREDTRDFFSRVKRKFKRKKDKTLESDVLADRQRPVDHEHHRTLALRELQTHPAHGEEQGDNVSVSDVRLQ